MKIHVLCFFTLLTLSNTPSFAQAWGVISGKITSEGKPMEFAHVSFINASLGASADTAGFYTIKNLPAGTYTIRVSRIGYTPVLKTVILADRQRVTVNFELHPAESYLNEVVVTGTRTSRRRLESPVAVNILDSKLFDLTQSNTLSEGLCFQPGLRMETDCQTCNYTQLRMNGLGGAYTQVLINSRPVFTSLMSLYGLEQIPANMIERVEVVRGGGSVLYGTSAIAGTVNVITKEPEKSSFTISNNVASIQGKSTDHILNANATIVNDEQSAGISFFASHRNREAYDANGDDFSELPLLINNSFGFNSFLKLNARDQLEINGWSIYENRRGGNKIDEVADKADQSEYRLHNILLGGFDFEHQYADGKSSFNLYASAQHTKRTHYTGIDHADGWGSTKSYSMQSGAQFNYRLEGFLQGTNVITTGIEHLYEDIFDEIKGYNYLIDQSNHLTGIFLQSDWEVSPKLTLLSGLRVNKHTLVKDLILTPRFSMLYKAGTTTQFRLSYARGFKAPQAFETDMHIAFAGGGISLIVLDPALKVETSASYNASVDFNKAHEQMIYGFTADVFYTRLHNAFVLEETGMDGQGNRQLLRKNGGNSTVAGITLEGRINYDQLFQLETGLTLQQSEYNHPVQWSTDIPGIRQYLRTPDVYGFYTLTMLPESRFSASISGVLTGPMKVPHFAGAPGVDKDGMAISPTFLENNVNLSYRFTINSIQRDLQLNVGVQNIFDQYQQDFDTGKNRDSNYIYGPARPRTFFLGLKFGLM